MQSRMQRIGELEQLEGQDSGTSAGAKRSGGAPSGAPGVKPPSGMPDGGCPKDAA